MLRSAWYVMCYHDLRWTEPPHLRGLGICHSPDMFDAHLDLYSSLGDVVSYEEGRRLATAGNITRPTFSLTFDDGYRGVVDHALPRLADRKLSALASVNPPFLGGESTFWRAQICWIREAGALATLAAALGPLGYSGGSLRDFTMDNFDSSVLETVRSVYERCASPVAAHDRHSLHTDADGVIALRDAGWQIANHSSQHLPLLETTAQHMITAEYTEAEDALVALIGEPTRSWVAPFDRPLQRSPSAVKAFRAAAGSRDAVFVGDRATNQGDLVDGVVYRSFAPVGGTGLLEAQLTRASRRSTTSPPHLESP